MGQFSLLLALLLSASAVGGSFVAFVVVAGALLIGQPSCTAEHTHTHLPPGLFILILVFWWFAGLVFCGGGLVQLVWCRNDPPSWFGSCCWLSIGQDRQIYGIGLAKAQQSVKFVCRNVSDLLLVYMESPAHTRLTTTRCCCCYS